MEPVNASGSETHTAYNTTDHYPWCICVSAACPAPVVLQQVIGVDEQMLLSAIARPLGFHKGKPLAALIIFRCCLEWGAVGARKTRTFEHIIQVCVCWGGGVEGGGASGVVDLLEQMAGSHTLSCWHSKPAQSCQDTKFKGCHCCRVC